MARYWSKIAAFNLPYLYLVPPLGYDPVRISPRSLQYRRQSLASRGLKRVFLGGHIAIDTLEKTLATARQSPPAGAGAGSLASENSPWVSYGACFVILRLAVLAQCRCVTDGRTDRKTRDNSIYRTSIASSGKNYFHIPARW